MDNTGLHKELWEEIYHWLRLMNNRISKDYCRNEISTHAEYPSLLSVSDFLELGGLEFKVAKTDLSISKEVDYPVLLHINSNGEQYIKTVSSYAEWHSDPVLINSWSGIIILAFEGAKFKNKENDRYLREERSSRFFMISLVSVLSLIYGYCVFVNSGVLYNLFGGVALIGALISLIIFFLEIGYQNDAVKQVCGTFNKRGGCETVIKSKYSISIWGFSPADLSLIYFGSLFITFIISVFAQSISYIAVIPISFLGLPIIFWSLYTQFFKVKEWCVLCLLIIVFLAIHIIIAANIDYANFIINNKSFGCVALTGLLLMILIIPIKRAFQSVSDSKPKIAELRKWKSDSNLFLSFWEKEPKIVDDVLWENEVTYGNPNSPIKITMACNPYCGPCAQTHKQINELFGRFESQIQIKIRFFFYPDIQGNVIESAVESILQRATTITSSEEMKEMIHDWYTIYDIDKWKSIWKPDSSIDVKSLMQKHNRWIIENHIVYTPTVYLNGRKFPSKYSVQDLNYLILDLVEASKISKDV
jgi:uncharacterized membrane protein